MVYITPCTPLVISALRGRHTDTQTCTHTDVHTISISRNQILAGQHAPGLKIIFTLVQTNSVTIT